MEELQDERYVFGKRLVRYLSLEPARQTHCQPNRFAFVQVLMHYVKLPHKYRMLNHFESIIVDNARYQIYR